MLYIWKLQSYVSDRLIEGMLGPRSIELFAVKYYFYRRIFSEHSACIDNSKRRWASVRGSGL